MDNIVPSLFGITPEQLGQQRSQEAYAKSLQMAQLDSGQRGAAGLMQAGAAFRPAVNNMFGIVDPEMEKVKQQQELNSQLDLSSPEKMRQSAEMLRQKGFLKEAFGLSQLADKKETELADRAYKKALAAKAMTGGRDYEYEKMMEILNDPDSSEEMKTMAKARIAALNAKSTGSNNTSSVQTFKITDENGTYIVRAEKGIGGKTEVMTMDGKPLTPAEYSPTLKAKLTQAGAGGAAVGKAAGEAQQAAVDAESVSETANRQLDELLNHEGFASAVGIGMPYASKFTGAKEMAFKKRLDQIKGGAFLQAFNMLRGGGQITEVEGQKATDAMNRMDMATSEKEFREAADDYRMALKTGIEKLKKKGALSYQLPEPAGTVNTPETVTKTTSPKFDKVTSPFQVRAMYKAGKMSKEDANVILDDMKARGLF